MNHNRETSVGFNYNKKVFHDGKIQTDVRLRVICGKISEICNLSTKDEITSNHSWYGSTLIVDELMIMFKF